MSRQTINAIVIAVATGVLANFAWMWIEPLVPKPRTDSPVAKAPSAGALPLTATKSVDSGPKTLPSTRNPTSVARTLLIGIAAVVEIILCLWLVICPLQFILESRTVLGGLYEWIDDNIHPILWLIAFGVAGPIAVFCAAILAEWHTTVIWCRIIRQSFRAASYSLIRG
jgi:hypothetical protein